MGIRPYETRMQTIIFYIFFSINLNKIKLNLQRYIALEGSESDHRIITIASPYD